jgi:NodT family efflux transporter outer membrane factor (OMF) lipoprotein
MILTACVHRNTKPEVPEVATSPIPFTDSGKNTAPVDWWTEFADPQLNTLITRALEGNFSLQASWQRLQATQAIARQSASELFPSLTGAFSAASTSNTNEFDGRNSGEFLISGLAAEYEIDLWGRIRDSVDAERLEATASFADYQAATISLAAEIARTWYQLVWTNASLKLLEAQVATNEKALESLKARFQGGQVRSVDLLRQQQLLEATREQIFTADANRKQLCNQLAVLVGQVPQENPIFQMETGDLPTLPTLPATGLPADLALRRPDLQAGMLRLKSADRQLAATISQRYPRINLSASLTSLSQSTSGLFEEWIQSIAAELIVPIIDGGERRANIVRSRAVKEQRFAEFAQASLQAFSEVETALAIELGQSERVASLNRRVRLQKATYKQLKVSFSNGDADFLELLASLTSLQQLERNFLSARRQEIEARIDLYRALAGPIEPEPRLVQNHE